MRGGGASVHVNAQGSIRQLGRACLLVGDGSIERRKQSECRRRFLDVDLSTFQVRHCRGLATRGQVQYSKPSPQALNNMNHAPATLRQRSTTRLRTSFQSSSDRRIAVTRRSSCRSTFSA
eukprot:287253-Rhodomonas_salina.1